jgi:hypothetical protein
MVFPLLPPGATSHVYHCEVGSLHGSIREGRRAGRGGGMVCGVVIGVGACVALYASSLAGFCDLQLGEERVIQPAWNALQPVLEPERSARPNVA